ncbi:Nucleoside-diphosphate-sugar epimerase [Hyella patelloides LEGE 07179]|uniref:Nucleoside-diphosphate-sugar epimerase n=1 Tax=Hyella patelloides LEGE 07179 TaxID=945734 RepID=A0A563W2D7_9CYAN|nr:SDR family oxidoreductase [Hyella patelloides]VEP17700.1 Nucleoside-diphosphate-sugar epimerase [Hyella patelloides LEGE 07179]VEP17703.1 Nucleoside-diphosphate-sugar epimerase [Hyella patelloides LEGE 07179]
MNTLILGCGYVGSQVARLWQKNGHRVTATTTTPEKVAKLSPIADRVAIVEGSDLSAVSHAIKDREVVLFSVGAKGKDTYRQSYSETATNLVTALQNNNSVKQVIYTGSYGVLGDRKGQWTDETIPANPVTDGGKILAETEDILLAARSEKLKVCILRLAGIYGEGRELIKIFRRWSGTTRPGKGDDYSNWIHLEDIVNAIEVARDKQLDGIYNLACDECLTTGEFFQRLFTTHNMSGITWDATKDSTRSYNTRLSNQKIKDAGMKFIYPEIIFG